MLVASDCQGCDDISEGVELFLHPFQVCVAHDSISSSFRNGTTLDDAIDAALKGQLSPLGFPPLLVVNTDNVLFAVAGNRRLFLFRVLAALGVWHIVRIRLIPDTHDLFHAKRFDAFLRRKGTKWDRAFTAANSGQWVDVKSRYAHMLKPMPGCLPQASPSEVPCQSHATRASASADPQPPAGPAIIFASAVRYGAPTLAAAASGDALVGFEGDAECIFRRSKAGQSSITREDLDACSHAAEPHDSTSPGGGPTAQKAAGHSKTDKSAAAWAKKPGREAARASERRAQAPDGISRARRILCGLLGRYVDCSAVTSLQDVRGVLSDLPEQELRAIVGELKILLSSAKRAGSNSRAWLIDRIVASVRQRLPGF